jgi:peroxiredoxin
MKKLMGLLLAVAAGAGALVAMGPVPRPATAFKLHFTKGPDVMLSSLKGKVVIVQFLFTGCPHCQKTAGDLSQLNSELGAKGLKVYGVAFNDEVNTKDDAANKREVQTFDKYAKFPVAYASQDSVLKFLGVSAMELNQLGVPQLVVIDKNGTIKAQTPLTPGAGSIADPAIMRSTVTKLLAGK